MTHIDYSKKYNQYVEDVLSGRIIACKWIKLACQRYLDWFDRSDIYFDYEDVDKKIRFMQKLKLREGPNFILLPYQAWIVASIFGWKYTDEDNLKRQP